MASLNMNDKNDFDFGNDDAKNLGMADGESPFGMIGEPAARSQFDSNMDPYAMDDKYFMNNFASDNTEAINQ